VISKNANYYTAIFSSIISIAKIINNSIFPSHVYCSQNINNFDTIAVAFLINELCPPINILSKTKDTGIPLRM
jgi:hypothetical protein